VPLRVWILPQPVRHYHGFFETFTSAGSLGDFSIALYHWATPLFPSLHHTAADELCRHNAAKSGRQNFSFSRNSSSCITFNKIKNQKIIVIVFFNFLLLISFLSFTGLRRFMLYLNAPGF